VVVAEDAVSGAVLATGSLIVERKLVHGCGRVGHVEVDICIVLYYITHAATSRRMVHGFSRGASVTHEES